VKEDRRPRGKRAGKGARGGPPKLRLDHVGIAVEDMGAARERFEKILSTPASPVEEVPSERVKVSFFDLAGARIELLEGTGPESPVRKFLDGGRSGVHHISIRVEGGSIDGLFEELSARGVPVIGSGPRPGSGASRVFFIHPRAADGVLIEFSSEEGT
jgi:methylmalonyl-CoA epimerase